MWSNKRQERCGFKLVSSKSSCHIVDFHLSNTVLSVDLFVIVVAAAVVVPVAVAVGKNVQQ